MSLVIWLNLFLSLTLAKEDHRHQRLKRNTGDFIPKHEHNNLAFLSPFGKVPRLAVSQKFHPSVSTVLKLQGGEGNPMTSLNFTHGVASGDPRPKNIILWTRLAPVFANASLDAPRCPDVHARVLVSKFQDFRRIAFRSRVSTNCHVDYTIKVAARFLRPSTKYYYKFIAKSPQNNFDQENDDDDEDGAEDNHHHRRRRGHDDDDNDDDNDYDDDDDDNAHTHRLRIQRRRRGPHVVDDGGEDDDDDRHDDDDDDHDNDHDDDQRLDIVSPIGETKTAPRKSEHVDQLKFAVVSCSNLEYGFFNAYRLISQRKDEVDAVIHLGDYIYEYPNGAGAATSDPNPNTFFSSAALAAGRKHIPNTEILSLKDYRTRYANYRADLDLQEAHRVLPFITVWDDHESSNDAFANGAQNHQEGEGPWEERVTRAVRAYFEWMPIRQVDPDDDRRIYRSFQYGDLLDLIMIDTRLDHRAQQLNAFGMNQTASEFQSKVYAPLDERGIMSETQRAWIEDEFTESLERGAKWRIVGNQIALNYFFFPIPPGNPLGIPPNLDQGVFYQFQDTWAGYAESRRAFLRSIDAAVERADKQASDANVVVVTGDFHFSAASSLLMNSRDSNGRTILSGEPRCSEYQGPSVTSQSALEFILPLVVNGTTPPPMPIISAIEAQFTNGLKTTNPTLKQVDIQQHGYFVLSVTPERTEASYYFIKDPIAKGAIYNFGVINPQADEELGFTCFSNAGENAVKECVSPVRPTPAPTPRPPPQPVVQNPN